MFTPDLFLHTQWNKIGNSDSEHMCMCKIICDRIIRVRFFFVAMYSFIGCSQVLFFICHRVDCLNKYT